MNRYCILFLIGAFTLCSNCKKEDKPIDNKPTINSAQTEQFRSNPASPAYYINSIEGNDANDGKSPKTAWQNLDRLSKIVLKPGDIVRLARGSVWKNQNIYLANGSAGSEDAPVIIEAYGEGTAPLITEPRALWDKSEPYSAVYFGTGSRYITLLDISISETGSKNGISITKETQNITIAGTEIYNCGTAIAMDGKNHKIIANNIHHAGAAGLGGGIGIVFAGSNLEMAWNTLKHCIVTRPDGKLDGSPFEYYGRRSDSDYDLSDNIHIHHNTVDDCLNFIEAYGNATNMVIAYNLYKNSSAAPFQIHLDDCEHPTWTHECTYDLRIENNTMIASKEPSSGGWGMVGLLIDWDHLPDPQKSRVVVRNNLFVTNHTILSWVNPLSDNLIHDHNLFYFLNNGSLSLKKDVWIQGETEIIANPKFVNFEEQDFRLTETSPAIKAGTASAYKVDILGNPLPSGTPVDIGAYQYSK